MNGCHLMYSRTRSLFVWLGDIAQLRESLLGILVIFPDAVVEYHDIMNLKEYRFV